MIRTDEDALICDLAETYRIYDYRSLPVKLLATLSCGLGSKSRIKLKLAELKVPYETLLMAMIYDKLSWLAWTKTKDGEKGTNRPPSLYEALAGTEPKKQKIGKNEVFDSPEDFEARRAEILNNLGGGANG